MRTTSKIGLIAGTLIILGLIGGGIYFRKGNQPSFTAADWTGKWEIAYHYVNDRERPYRGTLVLSLDDQLSANLEVFPPKSIRPEYLTLQSLSVSDDHTTMTGELVHRSFKINEGFPKETFEWTMESSKAMSGKGSCIEYCAEGTEGVTIIWQGKKIEGATEQ